MSNSASQSAAALGMSATSSVTVATGVLETINAYAPLIGICISLISMFLAILFFTLNYIRSTKNLNNMKQDIKMQVLNDLRKHSGVSGEAIKELENMVD